MEEVDQQMVELFCGKLRITWKGISEKYILLLHHLFMEEDVSYSEDKEICSSFAGMPNDNICTIFIYLVLFFQV